MQRALVLIFASIAWLPAWGEEPVPPLSAGARILWDALIEIPPQFYTSDFWLSNSETLHGGDRAWEEFLRHTQVRERLIEAAQQQQLETEHRIADFDEILTRIRSVTGLRIEGAEQIRADYRREFQMPRPLSARERHLRAEPMARSEFGRRYPGRSVDDSPEHRLEYSRLVNRFELELEAEKKRGSINSRVATWARRWRSRLQADRERLAGDRLSVLYDAFPEASPSVIGIPLNPELENYIRSSDMSRVHAWNGRHILGHPSAQPEVLDFRSIQTRFPDSMTFVSLIPGSAAPNDADSTKSHLFYTEDSGSPPRRWLFYGAHSEFIDHSALKKAFRENPSLLDIFDPSFPGRLGERFMVDRGSLFTSGHFDHASGNGTAPTVRSLDLWLLSSIRSLDRVIKGEVTGLQAGAEKEILRLMSRRGLARLYGHENIRQELNTSLNPVTRKRIVRLSRARQANLDRPGLEALITRAAVGHGGFQSYPSLNELVDREYRRPMLAQTQAAPSFWDRVTSRFRRTSPSSGSGGLNRGANAQLGKPSRRTNRATNAGGIGSDRPLYLVRGETRFLDMIEAEELETERTRVLPDLVPGALATRHSVSISSVEPFYPASLDIAVPTPHAQRLSQVELTQITEEGTRQTLKRGTDYTVLESLDGRAVFIRLSAKPPFSHQFEFAAHFIPPARPGRARAHLPNSVQNLNPDRLLALSAHLREAGFRPLADRVDGLVRSATPSRRISVFDLQGVFKEEGIPTFGNTQEGGLDPENPIRQFSPFLNEEGRPCMTCGPAERFFTQALNFIFEGTTGVRAVGRVGFNLSDSANGIVRGRNHHARTELTFDDGERLPIDATPVVRRTIAERVGLKNAAMPLTRDTPGQPRLSANHLSSVRSRIQGLSAARSAHIETMSEIRRIGGRAALPVDRSDPSSVALRLSESFGAWLRADISLEEFDLRLLETLAAPIASPARTPADAVTHLQLVIARQKDRLIEVTRRLERDPHAPASLLSFGNAELVDSTRRLYSAMDSLLANLNSETIGEWFAVSNAGVSRATAARSCPTLGATLKAVVSIL